MTKAIIEFDLNGESDLIHYKLAMDAPKLYGALCRIGDAIRHNEKYDGRLVDREYFHEILSENNIDLDDYCG